MTPTLDYANTMLDIYLNDEPLNIPAIRHYRQLAADEQKRLERLERLENKEQKMAQKLSWQVTV